MIFDLFHSVSDPQLGGKTLGHSVAVKNFLEQTTLAESLGIDTLWLAESHFSSEIQKGTSVATIPNFGGEVGLNSDSFQWIQFLSHRTKRLNFGTAIHNILGGSGGPIASADRVNTLDFINSNFFENQRQLRMGIGPGRFPYQNTPFGIVPRSRQEEDLWPQYRRYYFLQALEIFLRLLKGGVVKSNDLTVYEIQESELHLSAENKAKYSFPIRVESRWTFEPIQLVPDHGLRSNLRIVLGSADPMALEIANQFWDVDLFNLSFTPPEQIEKLHAQMKERALRQGGVWKRSRLPRTVMVFLDPDRRKAHRLADSVLDAYIEAMRGTAAVPDKSILLQRALVGDASEVRDQLHPDNPRGFHSEDRLMLWFEFNQSNSQAICQQMKYFAEQVGEKLPC